MTITLAMLSQSQLWFPPVDQALHYPNGLLAVGGDLSPQRLLLAYRNGIFPWFSEGEYIQWWSPDPRAVFLPSQVHLSRSTRRSIRRSRFHFTINQAFDQVILACSMPRADEPGTWITDSMQDAYRALHQLGHAHSVEVWQENELVGGLYGVSIGQVFCGESMFHRASDASKAALGMFAQHFLQHGGKLIDCQMPTDHLLSLGAMPQSRQEFLTLLGQYSDEELSPGCWQNQNIRP